MARTLIHRRELDIINILDIVEVELECDPDNRVKIKEEAIEVTSNTNVTAGCIPVTNYSNTNTYDETLLSESNIPLKYVTDKETERMFNSTSDNVDKIVNLKRSNTKSVDEQVCNSMLTFSKEKHSSVEIYNNQDNNDESGAIINSNDEKLQNIKSVSKIQKQDILNFTDIKLYKKKSVQCNICFRIFSTRANYLSHQKTFAKYLECENCPFCKQSYLLDNLEQHKLSCESKGGRKARTYKHLCNFCKRQFSEKLRLQSHLFHYHGEYVNNTSVNTSVGSQNSKPAFINAVLKTYESLNSSDSYKFTKRDTRIDNINKTKENIIKTNKSMITKSPNNELSTKKSCQLTLKEYFKPQQNEHDIKTMSNKTNIVTNSSILSTSRYDKKTKESLKLKQIKQKEVIGQDKSLTTTTSDNFEKRVICSTLKPSVKNEIHSLTKPFVKLHVDVDTMANVLGNFPDSSNKSFDVGCNTEMKEIKTVLENKDHSSWKAAMIRFNCKDCTISLRRCDEELKNRQKFLTLQTTCKQNSQCNSTSLCINDIHSNKLFKKLEVRLERLKNGNAKKKKTTLTCNDNFFRCNICGETFSSKLDKHVHIKSFHVAYMSSICNARYRMKHKLLQHYYREHCYENQCGVCKKVILDSVVLRRHLYTHCLRYIQKKDDQYPINVEIKCRSAKKSYDYSFDKTAYLQSHLITNNQKCDLLLRETTKNQEDLAIKNFSEMNKMNIDKNTDRTTVTPDEKDQSDQICGNSSNKSTEELQKSQLSLTSATGLNVIEGDIDHSVEDEISSQLQGSEQESNNLTISSTRPIMQSNIVTEEDIYLCNVCRRKFHDRKDLEQHNQMLGKSISVLDHLLSSHVVIADSDLQFSKIYNFHCMFCDQSFHHKYNLRTHILHFHIKELNELRTSLCDAEMSKEYLDNASNRTTVCDICDVKFETYYRYMEHKLYYYGNYTFGCSLCDKKFRGMYMYHYHNKMTHFTEDKSKYYYICDICKEGFTHKLHFYSHKMHVHSNKDDSVNNTKIFEKKDHCDDASITRKENGMLVEKSTDPQRKAKQISRKYICHICKLKHADIDDLINKKLLLHIQHGDFTCNVCNMKYTTFKQFDRHIKLIHLDSVTNSEYVCPIITKVMRMNTLSSNKCEYNCLFCDIKFSSVDHVRKHIIRFHISKLLNSRSALKLKTSASDNNDIQNVSLQKVTTERKLSFKNNLTQSHQQRDNISPTEITSEYKARSVNSSNSVSITDSQRNLNIRLLTKRPINKTNINSRNSLSTTGIKKSNLVVALCTPRNSHKFSESNDKEILHTINYMCPICRLRYASLISFQSHLRFTHMDFIRASMVNPELNQLAQRTSRIECLLCECVFTEEIDYKKHIEEFHINYISNSEEIREIDNAEIKSNNLVHNEFNEVSNICHDHTYTKIFECSTESSVVTTSSKKIVHAFDPGNGNIGKLRVKPFAKIIECLSADALKISNIVFQ